MTRRKHWSDLLARLGACDEAVAWARDYPTIGAAWKACERAEWIGWMFDRLGGRDINVDRLSAHRVWNEGRTYAFYSVDEREDSWVDGSRMVARDWCAYLRSAMPIPTLADLRAVIAGKPSPWVKA